MNQKAETLEQRAIVEALAHLNGMGYERAKSMLAEVERAAAETAWDDGRAEGFHRSGRSNPYRKETR